MDYVPPFPSAMKILLLFGAAWVVYGIVYNIIRERQIRALGGSSPRRVSYVVGLDIIYELMRDYSSNKVLDFWLRSFRKYGKAANPWTIEFGNAAKRHIFTADPENIKAILATQFQDFGKGEVMHRQWYEFLGDGIFMVDGAQWHDARQLIRPQFIRDRLSNLKVFEKHVSALIPMLEKGGGTVDLSNLIFRFTLDAATDFLLGRSVNSLASEQARFASAFDYVQHIHCMIARMQTFAAFIPKAKLRRELKVLDDFVSEYIDDTLRLSGEELEKTSRSDDNYTFLHALAAYTRDRKQLRDQIMSVLLAGRDTTACTLSWLFYELAVHPHAYAKLRNEILAQVGPTRQPTYSDLKDMRYLQHTISETLRLYPVVPYNGRVAFRDTTIPRGGGADGNQPVAVMRGDMVMYSPLVMQRREDLYPEAAGLPPAHAFAPERWDSWTPRSWHYVPFNGGPRICIGQQFALTEMAYTVTRVLQRFKKLEYRGDGHPRMKADIVLAPARPVLVEFTAADASAT